MQRILTALLLCTAAQAATLSVNISATATIPLSGLGGSSFSATGRATLTGGIADSGTLSATIALSATSGNYTGPYTLTLTNGTLGGTLTIPIAVLTGSGSGTMSVTSAGGTYAGDSGSFNISGTGSVGASGIGINLTGSGTINTGGTVTAPPPVITAVLDAGSYGPTLPEGGIFVVRGSNLSDSGYNIPSALPYPTTFRNTEVTFTSASGAKTDAYIAYTYNLSGTNQIAAIVPSTLAAGTYNVTVTYNSTTSAAFSSQVVVSKPGIFTQDGTGSGLAVVQNIVSATQYDINRLTTGTVNGYTISPAKPGQTLVLWTTGLGPVPFADNIAPPAFTYSNVQVIVGGTSITPLYAGVSGFPGETQINITLPSNIQTGCTVPLQLKVGNVTSAATTVSIAPSSSDSACVLAGFTTAQLQALDNGGTYTTGGFSIDQITETIPTLGTIKADNASGAFTQVTGFELSSVSSTSTVNTNQIGSCTVYTVTSGASTFAGGSSTFLDAGQVTLTGPSGTSLSNTPLTESGNSYSLNIGDEGTTLPGSLNGKILAGTYTLTAAGGKDVGKFTVSLTLGTPLTITGGLPSSVTESAGLTINWTGGNASDIVEIIGSSGVSTGSGANLVTTTTEFICTTTAGPGTFTVPSSVLTQLPVTTANNTGFLEVVSTPTPVPFTAPLTVVGSVNATFAGLLGTGATVTYQ